MKNADRGKNRYIVLVLTVLLFIVLLIWVLFRNLIGNYETNTAAESADHLIELNYQIKLYIEEKINSDWQVAHSVANILESSPLDEDRLLSLVRSEMALWDVSDITLFAKNGRVMSVSGEHKPNDVASEIIYRTREQGEYLSIMQSSMTYSIPLNTEAMLGDSQIAALSLVQDLSSFLDHMEFSSFDGSAFMYLTQDNGVVISRLTHQDASDVYNIMSLFRGTEMTCLHGDAHEYEKEILMSDTAPYTMHNEKGKYYVVSTPVVANRANLRLFYIVPEEIVNHTMTTFSGYVTLLCVMVITVFAAVAIIISFAFYRSRKARFDTQLIARERMFDLLVRNTSTAFGLFSVNLEKPIYISSNAESIIGEQYLTLTIKDGKYHFLSASGNEDEGLKLLNDRISHWDGVRAFESGFIPRETVSGMCYYSIHLYGTVGDAEEFVGIAQDVTDDREREDALKTALDMADRASEAKTRFLSNMSHDIRTPMNAIVNMTDFAMNAVGDPAAQREYLNTIRESSAHLLHLINDVLDMSRVESGKAVVLSEPFDIRECLRGVCDMIRPLVDRRDQRFIADIDRLQIHFLVGDKLKVSQILINLLNNAVKFTPKRGRLRFAVAEMPSIRKDVVTLRFTVEDNGVGIAPEMVPHVFEPFMRGDERRVSGTEGTGLGLSICKSYVGAMGGTISCESEPGKGSVFTVEIPFKRALSQATPAQEETEKEKVSFAGKRALLCEDNLINQMIARKILEQLGFAVETAANGAEGEKMFVQSTPGYYDIIYMDIQMPVMDGYQATTAIRAADHPDAAKIPIVAMTANVFTEDVEKSRAAGMNGHIGKPISMGEVVDVTKRSIYP